MQTHEILFDQKLTNGGTNTLQKQSANTTNSNDDNDETNEVIQTKPRLDSLDEDHKIKFLDWGFKMDRLFEVAYRFYKRNENKAFHLGFDERNRMTALIMQARFGNFDDGKAPDIGVLDLVGKRRQHEWSLLKGMSKTEAMTKFICELDDVCPIFKAHAEAVKISSGLTSQTHHNDESGNGMNKLVSQSGDPSSLETSAQLKAIYSSLCKQTHSQFKSYAEKQHPGDATKQKHLITSLQEQYYQQYISQMHPKLRDALPSTSQSSNTNSNITSSMPSPASSNLSTNNEASTNMSATKLDLQYEAVKDDGQVGEVTETNGLNKQNSKLDDMKMRMGNEQSEQFVEEIKPVNISDIKCEDDNVQADISCEELNSELNFDMSDIPTNNDQPKEESSSTIPTKNPDSIIPSLHNELSQQNLVETVKLGQNPDLPPIGMFESFPEPKLVQNPYQKQPLTIDTIDPNLPSKSIRQTQDGLANIQIEPNDTSGPSLNQMDPVRDCNQPLVINPYDQDQTHNSNNNLNTDQNLDQGFLPIPTEYSEPNPDENYQAETEPIDRIDAQELKSQTPVNSLVEPFDQQQARQPELWDPPSSSDGGGCSPVDFQTTFNYEPPEPATIWTKRAVAEFKDSLSGDKQGGVYEIKEGALIIIQVPTYPDGKYIYWEFATDNYDIAFGVDFVRDEHLVEPMALNIYQDNDDDDLEELLDADNWQGTSNLTEDPEYCQSGIVSDRDRLVAEKRRRLANTMQILSTYRRDSHEEVIVGRHKYPGRGYYQLKFDNTYSVLRSKTLYFRICYFM